MVAVSGSTREIRPRLKGINGPTQGCSELLSNLMLSHHICWPGPARPGQQQTGAAQFEPERPNKVSAR